MATDSIREKIQKLLNMTPENGCTEDEAETAMRMAAGLMARHGIQEDEIRASNPNLKKGAKRIRVTAKLQKHQIILAEAAGHLFGCEVWTYNNGKYGFEFVGREENAQIAQDTMFWLIRQVDFIYKAHLPKGLTQRERKNYRDSFKDHCAARVLERARRLVWEMQQEEAAARSTGSTALVVANHFAVLRQEINEVKKVTVFGKPRNTSLRRGAGAGEGYRAGDQVQLHKPKEVNGDNTKRIGS